MMDFALALLLGLALGGIPFGLVLTRAAGLGDIRGIGSGNIGATNVLRTGNKALALATLLLDAGKGAASVGLAWALLGWDVAPYAGMAAGVKSRAGLSATGAGKERFAPWGQRCGTARCGSSTLT